MIPEMNQFILVEILRLPWIKLQFYERKNW